MVGYFFPRSLRQLVLLAFLLVILPLLFLAVKAYLSLDNLSSKAAELNQGTLNAVQRAETMTNLALSMERSYRQYCVLKDQSLDDLYQQHYARYQNILNNHKAILEEDKTLYQAIWQSLTAIKSLKCNEGRPQSSSITALDRFSKLNNDMLQATRNNIFLQGEQLQESIAKQGEFFGQWTLIVLLLSMGLVLLFTHMIIGPVKIVNQLIMLLGEGKFINSHVSMKGPYELQQLMQKIVWLSERLAWLESQRYQFLRHISHELKTPLASMREGTELLADEVVGPLTHDQNEVVEILDESSRHLQRLIEQLLNYNRNLNERGLEKQSIDLSAMVNEIITTHQLSAKAKNMQTECHLQINEVWGELKLLMRIIDNLYSNAVHYGEEGGKIWIFSHEESNYLHIDVANTGMPIAEKDKSMLFEPFYQGSQSRKGAVKGSGLGLSIARDCINHMQGKLSLIEVNYAQVCFRIKLPLRSNSGNYAS